MPVDPNHKYVDVAHEKTVIDGSYRYGCFNHEKRKGTTWVQDGYVDALTAGGVAIRHPKMIEIEINFLDIDCGHMQELREADPYCVGCKWR